MVHLDKINYTISVIFTRHIHGFMDRSFLFVRSWSTRVHGAEKLQCKVTVHASACYHFMPKSLQTLVVLTSPRVDHGRS